MHPFRLVLISIFVCIWSVHARSLPSFDMDTCVGEATTIVQGKLDSKGELEVSEIFSGPSAPSQRLKIDVGSYEAENLRKLVGENGPFEVVAFLTKKDGEEWSLVLQYAGIVGFKGQAVFLMADDLIGSRFTKHEPFTKDSFFQALKESIAGNAERGHLIAEPRSIDRTKKLIAFALEHCQASEEKDGFRGFHPNYQLGQIATALNNSTEDDQNALLHALQQATSPHDQIILLNLAQRIPLKDGALDQIATFLPRSEPPLVREAAMNALSAINGYKAVDYLVPYLVLDDPQLATVLENFASQSYPAKKELFNIDAVEPLKKLAESMKGPDHVPLGNGYVIGAVSSQLCHYLHPRLIPILFKRAIYDDSSSSAQEFSDFHSAVGLKYPRDDKKSWETWWEKAQPSLEGEFNLQTATGRELWMDHYAHADVATQKILMNLWFFEVNIDEAALIDLAAKNEVAKQVLAELWKRERLSENGKQAIVKRFMTFRLVNDPPKEAVKDKTLYGVRLSTTSTFPFPDRAMVRNKIVVTVGKKSTLTMEVNQAIVSCPCTKKAKNLAPSHGGRASQARRRQMRL